MTPGRAFLWTQAAAIALSFAHTVLDWHVGLFGVDRAVLTGSAAALLGIQGTIYAGWTIGMALSAERAWMAAVLVFSFGWAFLASGSSILFCLPPCQVLAPWGDIAHLASLFFGGWASLLAWRGIRSDPRPLHRRPLVAALVVLVAAYVTSSALTAEFIASQQR